MTFGWSVATPAGAWTHGPLALLRLGAPAAIDANRSLILDVDEVPLVMPAHPQLIVDLVVNGARIDAWTFELPGGLVHRRTRIPGSIAASRPELDIEFRVQNPEALLYLGTGFTTSFDGLCVRRLSVTYQ